MRCPHPTKIRFHTFTTHNTPVNRVCQLKNAFSTSHEENESKSRRTYLFGYDVIDIAKSTFEYGNSTILKSLVFCKHRYFKYIDITDVLLVFCMENRPKPNISCVDCVTSSWRTGGVIVEKVSSYPACHFDDRWFPSLDNILLSDYFNSELCFLLSRY